MLSAVSAARNLFCNDLNSNQNSYVGRTGSVPCGERIDMQRQKVLLSLQVFMLISSLSSYRRLHLGSISSAPGQSHAGGPCRWLRGLGVTRAVFGRLEEVGMPGSDTSSWE